MKRQKNVSEGENAEAAQLYLLTSPLGECYSHK